MAHRTCRGLDGRVTAVRERQVSVSRPQFILLIEPDDDSRVMYAEYQIANLRNEGRYVTMPWTRLFYSVDETSRPPLNRVHHDNSACPAGRDMPLNDRRTGTGGYRLCDDCDRLNKQGR